MERAITMSTITLTTNFGYDEYWVRDATGLTVNATTAEWRVAGDERVPAINIFDSKGVVFDGGKIWGEVSLTGDWQSIYNHMSTGFRVSNSPDTTIRNVHIDQAWDGIRFIPDDTLKVANGTSNGWLVEDVLMTNIRDDAIENDFAHTGTLRDSLLDGVQSGIGSVNDQSAKGVLTVDDSIIIMKDFLKDGELSHGTPFKFNTEFPENNPDLRIFNSIIAVQDPEHNGLSRLKEAWANLTESSGNYYLNLSDTPFPSNYPLPPKGFTILQGKEARDFLAAEKSKWLAEHAQPQEPGEPTSTDTKTSDPAPAPEPVEPTPTETVTKTSSGTVIEGTSDQDVLIGTSGNDIINGKAKGDFIYGKGGNDTLTGGTSWDKFVFDTALDGTVDTITDFKPGADTIWLDTTIFTKLGSATSGGRDLDSGYLVTGTAAKDANDYIIYDKASGKLSYDADGSGSGAAKVFAKVTPGLDLSSSDFTVFKGASSTTTASSSTTTTSSTSTGTTTTKSTSSASTSEPASSTGKTLVGGNQRDTLIGTDGNDVIDGKAKGDFLYGKGGSDILTGGTSWDRFVFDTALDGSVDTITDFDTSDDFIYLDNAVFTKLGSGSLSSPTELDSALLVTGDGAVAKDSNDYLIYDSRSGELSYDADGSGSGSAITFVEMGSNLDLTHADIFIV